MANLQQISSRTWGISTIGPGAIAEGLGSLRQCILIILRTTLGSDPLRPFFGSEVYRYQDAPVNIAIPNIKKSIIEALAIWEQRITVIEVKHYLRDLGHIEFEIVYGVIDSDLRDSILFSLYNGGLGNTTTSNLILQALFPPGISTKRNTISFVLNNAAVLPLPPDTGFANVNDTYAWVQANWSSYGTWYLLADRIQVYLRPGNYSQASLTIAVSSTYRFAVEIPVTPIDPAGYFLVFSPDTVNINEQGGLLTKEELLIYVRSNYSNAGNWQIENSNIVIPGEFNTDFNTDFRIDTTGYQLVLYTNTLTNPLITLS